jgi:site-specific DNA-methyltransferase (adenine-specific)
MALSEVYNEDCMVGMARYPDGYFDLAVVDPPYGIDIAKWDTKEHKPTPEYFEQLFRVSKNQIIWGANYFELPHNEAWICWDKTLANGKTALGKNCKSEFELAWTSFENKKAKLIRYTYDGNIQGFKGGKVDYKFKRIHPTQKPVALYDWILKNYAEPGQKILDTHLGSGSSRIAADRSGLDFVGFELDKEYFDASVKRFQQYKSQLVLPL